MCVCVCAYVCVEIGCVFTPSRVGVITNHTANGGGVIVTDQTSSNTTAKGAVPNQVCWCVCVCVCVCV